MELKLGKVVTTPGVMQLLLAEKINELLDRHEAGDWGDLDAEDEAANREALRDGERVFSSYNLPEDQKVWIITEAGRDYTTVLLPHEN